jgi:hypothetical protein
MLDFIAMTKLTQPNPRQLLQLASGQRMVNTCMFLGIASGAFKIIGAPLAIPLYLGLTLVAVLRTLLLAKGLAHTGFKLALLVIGSVIPLLGYLLMAWHGLESMLQNYSERRVTKLACFKPQT